VFCSFPVETGSRRWRKEDPPMNKQEMIKKKYDDFSRQMLKELEEQHGKEWIEKNRKKLERDREYFESLNLL
jgi:hypothetical protein